MDAAFHIFENHTFPSALAILLLWLGWLQYNKLATRLTTVENTNAKLLTTYATAFNTTMHRNNQLLEQLTHAFTLLQTTVANCQTNQTPPNPPPITNAERIPN